MAKTIPKPLIIKASILYGSPKTPEPPPNHGRVFAQSQSFVLPGESSIEIGTCNVGTVQ